MPSILLTNYYSERPLNIVKEELPPEFNLITLDSPSQEEVISKIVDADYLLVGGRTPIEKKVLKEAGNLKMIQRTGVGLDAIDLEAVKEKHVPLYINHGVNSFSVAEHTILLMLSVLRRLPVANSIVKDNKWIKHELGIQNEELKNKIVGLVGLGNIGTSVAKMLQGFDVRILYHKPAPLSKSREEELNVNYVAFKDILKEADVLSLHCPLNSDTEKMIGRQEILLMKRGSIIINTSRGQLIDEKALTEALDTEHIAGAGLDVFSEEPPLKYNQLFSFDNVVLTPHIAGLTENTFRKIYQKGFRNIKMFDEGKLEFLDDKKVQL